MQIHADVTFEGAHASETHPSLIDTGAVVTLLPLDLAGRVGASDFDEVVTLSGFNGHPSRCAVIGVKATFPGLQGKGGLVRVYAMPNLDRPIIGMDIMKPMGIAIDTRTHSLTINIPMWEGFKKAAAIGTIGYATVKVFDYLFSTDDGRCGAPTRGGAPCRALPAPGKKRCAKHAGMRAL